MTLGTTTATTVGTPAEHLATRRETAAVYAPGRGLDASRPLSVSRVAARLAEIIDTRLHRVRAIWVEGDIADLRSDARGSLRFTLSDGSSRIECVWWSPPPAAAGSLAGVLKVVVKGRPKVFTRAVGLVYVVEEIRPVGTGGRSSARDQLCARLSAEGLFDPARKRPLPRVPRAVAVITSRSSAAWHDVIAIAARRHPGIPVVLIPAQMQGDAAPESVCAAVRAAEASGLFDIVMITRGGGGAAELMAFDDESLVRTIAACGVPVVTAIGHEVDYSFADAVADCREPTPSAAAARVIPDRGELQHQLDACCSAMAAALRQRLQRDTSRLATAQSIIGRSALLQIEMGRRRLDRAALDVTYGFERRLERSRRDARRTVATLRSALPRLLETAEPRLVASHREMLHGMRSRMGHDQHRYRLVARELDHAMRTCVAHQSARQERMVSQFVALDPLAVLRRGYAVVRGAAGEAIISVRQVPPGATLVIQFHDGTITVSASAAGRVPDLTPGAEPWRSRS